MGSDAKYVYGYLVKLPIRRYGSRDFLSPVLSISAFQKIQFLQSRNIFLKGVKEDRVQKSHFSEDEVLMTTQVKNYSKSLIFRAVSLLMTQARSRLEKHVSAFSPEFQTIQKLSKIHNSRLLPSSQ